MTPGERAIRLPEAAALIGMSKSFLRGSTCPRHRMHGNGPKGRPVLIFYASEVQQWWQEREMKGPSPW
jgi:predicted DNA-binding transcriptional regulator AlpA